MANNVAASMTASIVINKNDIVVQALQELSKAQKELNNNKLEIFFDVSNADIAKKLKEFQKQLSGKDYVIKLQSQGVEEVYKSLGELINRVKDVASGKAFGSGNGKGIGNFIADEKSINSIIDLFGKMEKHLGTIRKVFADVGDGEEFSPLLKMINNVQSSISELSSGVKSIGFNMNIDIGSDKEMEAKLQGKISNALQAYQRLFEHIKMSSAGGSAITDRFFEFDITQYDTMMGKLKAYQKFIADMRKEAKTQFNGKDVLYQDTEKSYWTQASAAMGQVTKAFNEMNAASNTNPLSEMFGKTDLSEVVSQLGLIVAKLEEISTTTSGFKNVFDNGFNVTASVEEIDKLTNRVKELEDELSKVKLNPVDINKSNISSGNYDLISRENSEIEKQLTLEQKVANEVQRLRELRDSGADISKLPYGEINKLGDGTLGTIEKLNDIIFGNSPIEEAVRQILELRKASDQTKRTMEELFNKYNVTDITPYKSLINSFRTSDSDVIGGMSQQEFLKELEKQIINNNNNIVKFTEDEIKTSLKDIQKYFNSIEDDSDAFVKSITKTFKSAFFGGKAKQGKLSEALRDGAFTMLESYMSLKGNDLSNTELERIVNRKEYESFLTTGDRKSLMLRMIFGNMSQDDILSIIKGEFSQIISKMSSSIISSSELKSIDTEAYIEQEVNKVKSYISENFPQIKGKEKNSYINDIYDNLTSSEEIIQKIINDYKGMSYEEEEIQKTQSGSLRLISDIGLTKNELLDKIRKENEEIKNGNRLYQERITLLKDGKVIDSFIGQHDKVNAEINDNNIVADEILHTHPDINKTLGVVPAVQDLQNLEVLKNVKSFTMSVGNNLSMLSLPNGTSELIKLLPKYKELFNLFGTSITNGLSNDVLGKYAESFLKYISILSNGDFSKISASGDILGISNIDPNELNLIIKVIDKLISMGGNLAQVPMTMEAFDLGLSQLNGKFVDDLEQEKVQVEKAVQKINETTSTTQIDNTSSNNQIVESQNKIQEELKETQEQAEQTAKAVQDISETQIKDVFQGDDKSVTDASTTAIKEESKALEQVSASAKEASESKEKFAKANKEVKASAESSSSALKEEKENIGSVGNSAEETKKKLDDVVFKPNTEGFDEIVSKLDIAKDKIEEISKITKSSVWSESEGKYVESYNIRYKSGTSEIRGESSNKNGSNVLRANEVAYDAKAAEQEAKALEKANKERQKIADNTKLEEQKRIYKELNNCLDRYFTVSKRIQSNNALGSDEEEAARLQARIEELQNEPILSEEQLKASQLRLENIETTLEDIQKITKESTLNSLQSDIDRFNKDFNNRDLKPSNQTRSVEYQDALNKYKASITELENEKKRLESLDYITKDDLDRFKELEKEVQKSADAFKAFSAAQKGSTEIGRRKEIDKITKYLQENTRLSEEAKEKLQEYLTTLRDGGADVNVEEIHNAFLRVTEQERLAGREGKRFLDIIKDKAWYGWAAQLAGMFSFYDVINIGREAFETIKEYDNALTEMNKVSKESIETLKDFQKESFGLSDAIGTTASQIQNSTADFLRLGESFEQAKQSAQDANALFKVAEFDNIDEATEALVAMSQAYKELDKSQINDVLNYTGNNFSISTSELASALQRSAATLKVAGNDIYEATALVTAGNAVLQDAETVGSGKFMPKYIVICRYVYMPESSYIG